MDPGFGPDVTTDRIKHKVVAMWTSSGETLSIDSIRFTTGQSFEFRHFRSRDYRRNEASRMSKPAQRQVMVGFPNFWKQAYESNKAAFQAITNLLPIQEELFQK